MTALVAPSECTVKQGKAIPVTDRGGPQGCETSRLPYFSRQSAHKWL
jgi:predicted nucleic acid binding AN1-type Zn finger protein